MENNLKKGDIVRLISGGNNYPLNGFYNGSDYEVDNPHHTLHERVGETKLGYYVVIRNRNYASTGYAELHQLELLNRDIETIKSESTKH